MYKELKKAIVDWLLENETSWQRVNACVEEFRPYIYNKNGNYLIGGEITYKFIQDADDLLFKKRD